MLLAAGGFDTAYAFVSGPLLFQNCFASCFEGVWEGRGTGHRRGFPAPLPPQHTYTSLNNPPMSDTGLSYVL